MRVTFQSISSLLRSRLFFWAIVTFFVIESSWIAISAAYPQAFDEGYHFGIITIYSHHWLPFLASQPPHADAFGAVFRDPSYLYHYLMGFVLRFISLFTHDQTIQVILLRFVDIALMAASLILFHRVLLRAKVSESFANLSVALFVLIPIVPQLAGQVNYDNLLLPLVAWASLLAMQVIDEIQTRNPSLYTLLKLATLGTFATMVKYEFLPIFVAIVAFLVFVAYRNFHGDWRHFAKSLMKHWRVQTRLARVILVVLFLVSLILFSARDGVNLVKYHSFTPECSKVLSVQSCSKYSPWYASYKWHKRVVAKRDAGHPLHFDNPIAYTGRWMYWLWYRLFFAVNGPIHHYKNYPPLPLPAITAAIIGLVGLVVTIVALFRQRLFHKNTRLRLLGAVVVMYLAALWIEGILQYHKTGYMVLMNGRYLLPIVFFALALAWHAANPLLRHLPKVKLTLAILVLLLFIEGGGVFTFIMRSDASWYWPNSPATSMNDTARKVLHPIILEGNKTRKYNLWPLY